MFSQPPDDEHKTLQNNPRKRRLKSFKNKHKRKGNKKKVFNKQPSQQVQSHLAAITMSSWAENFTYAATWQLKHQIAYWKSKATALDYENRILHDIIRKNYVNSTQAGHNVKNESDIENITENVKESESSDDETDDDEEFVVSEEYIQFLMNNLKYKEDAKRERERLRASENTEQQIIEEMESMPSSSVEDKQKILKDLYGENWQRIAAIETSIESNFLNSCDQDKPIYWPNIPLNFC